MTMSFCHGGEVIAAALLVLTCQTSALPVEESRVRLRASTPHTAQQEMLSNVTFVLPRSVGDEDVKNVVLVGSWSGWRRKHRMEKNDKGEFTRTLQLPHGKFEFKVFKDGVQHQATKEKMKVSSYHPPLFANAKKQCLALLDSARMKFTSTKIALEHHKEKVLVASLTLLLFLFVARYQRQIL
ncbi:hypothetical protein GUITHDRAFT_119866 [Guillardia theta CCMP2712]|uniref:AMP-activated protein kinase glycogen-binding domain-containing protein n=1 Tax=Guillardia theta (strain CCMP2712) TaxID=905079 RepID=L1IDN8_GUITC|nr:hypothetical protein GUITHDRAFT_119866 [Guillardia theta CCMP2712]EKX33940.1 hypothetical protein GUITHDRAFT_119866 [Guillardia theta CCMP2712]|eukprot:XP_005820920.1 hypothetical protein GUITHDRAFT_119866 [Guillardia theta CCMP2712]